MTLETPCLYLRDQCAIRKLLCQAYTGFSATVETSRVNLFLFFLKTL